MKKVFKKPLNLVIITTILLSAIYSIYSRPMTISELYPMLTLDKCTGIRGYYFDGTKTDFTEFKIERNSDEFEKICSLFYQQEYRRSIRDILPRGTRTHQTRPGEYDFQWDVYFCFDEIKLPDGSIGSGDILNIQSWYGELDIHFDGENYSCYSNQQKDWERAVMDIIKSSF